MKKRQVLNKKNLPLILLPVVLIIMLGITSGIFAKDGKINLAVLPFENLNKDPDQEYLSGIIGSIVRQDLSLSGMVFLVNRDNMDDVLEEQKLQFTGVMDDNNIIESGRLVGAQYILKGGYVFLGQDLFLNLDLINTETGRSYSFSERGYQENTVHALTEKLIKHLSGQDMIFQSESGNKTIIAVSQREPGRVLLFSHLIDARVYVDGQFTAYTLGDSTIPLELTLPAGKHSIRTHLSQNFGVVQNPEILFSDWQIEFNLTSGQTLVLEDKTNHYNAILYDLQQVIREDIELIPGTDKMVRAEHSTSFTDRQGNEIPIELDLSFIETDEGSGGGIALVHLIYKGVEQNLKYSCPSGEELEFELELEKSSLTINLDCESEYRWRLSYSIWRNDIYQGLHREEPHQPNTD